MNASMRTRAFFWNWPFLSALTMALSIGAYRTGRMEFAVAAAAAFAALLWRLRPNPLQLFFIVPPALPIVAIPLSDQNTGYAALIAMAALLVWTGILCGAWRIDVEAKPLIAGMVVAVVGVALLFVQPGAAPVPTPTPTPKPFPPPPPTDPSDPQSQFVLALQYRNGDGVQEDDARALRLAVRAAEQGYAPAQTLAGMMYQNGVGVAADPYTAASYFLKAAEQDDPWAESVLGGMYLSGEGEEQNNVLAYKWLTKAAGQGNAAARSLLEAAEDTFTDEEREQGEAAVTGNEGDAQPEETVAAASAPAAASN